MSWRQFVAVSRVREAMVSGHCCSPHILLQIIPTGPPFFPFLRYCPLFLQRNRRLSERDTACCPQPMAKMYSILRERERETKTHPKEARQLPPSLPYFSICGAPCPSSSSPPPTNTHTLPLVPRRATLLPGFKGGREGR